MTFSQKKQPLIKPTITLFFYFLMAMTLTLIGCITVGPDYERPDPELPEYWHHFPDPALVPGKAAIRHWWTVFEDPHAYKAHQQAAESNLDLRLAVARVKESRARLGVVSGEQLPSVDSMGDITRQRSSDNDVFTGSTTLTRYSVAWIPGGSWIFSVGSAVQ